MLHIMNWPSTHFGVPDLSTSSECEHSRISTDTEHEQVSIPSLLVMMTYMALYIRNALTEETQRAGLRGSDPPDNRPPP